MTFSEHKINNRKLQHSNALVVICLKAQLCIILELENENIAVHFILI